MDFYQTLVLERNDLSKACSALLKLPGSAKLNQYRVKNAFEEIISYAISIEDKLNKISQLQFSADVILMAKGKVEVPAVQKYLSTQSSFFKAMFRHNMLENREKKVNLENFNACSLQKMVEFCTIGTVTNKELTHESFHDLVLLAGQVQIADLFTDAAVPAGLPLDLCYNILEKASLHISLNSNVLQWTKLRSEIITEIGSQMPDLLSHKIFQKLTFQQIIEITALCEKKSRVKIPVPFTVRFKADALNRQSSNTKITSDEITLELFPKSTSKFRLSFDLNVKPNKLESIVSAPKLIHSIDKILGSTLQYCFWPSWSWYLHVIVPPFTKSVTRSRRYRLNPNNESKIPGIVQQEMTLLSLQSLNLLEVDSEETEFTLILPVQICSAINAITSEIIAKWIEVKHKEQIPLEYEARRWFLWNCLEELLEVNYVKASLVYHLRSDFSIEHIPLGQDSYDTWTIVRNVQHLSRKEVARLLNSGICVKNEIVPLQFLFSWAKVKLLEINGLLQEQREVLWGCLPPKPDNNSTQVGKLISLTIERNKRTRKLQSTETWHQCPYRCHLELEVEVNIIIKHTLGMENESSLPLDVYKDLSDLLPLIRFPFIRKACLETLESSEMAYLQHLTVGQDLLREACLLQLATQADRESLKPKNHRVLPYSANLNGSWEDKVNRKRKKPRKSTEFEPKDIPRANVVWGQNAFSIT